MPVGVRNEAIDLLAINLPGFGFFSYITASFSNHPVVIHANCMQKNMYSTKVQRSHYILLYMVFSRHYPPSEQLQITMVFSWPGSLLLCGNPCAGKSTGDKWSICSYFSIVYLKKLNTKKPAKIRYSLRGRTWLMCSSFAKQLWKAVLQFVNKDVGTNSASSRVKTTLGQKCFGAAVVKGWGCALFCRTFGCV